MSAQQPTDQELDGWGESSQLLQFLESQHQQGSFQSSDEFTVNVLAAQKKFGSYALPRPSAWILKFVQAATEANCQRLDVWFSEGEVSLALQGGDLPGLTRMQDSLQTLSPDSAAEDHLLGGILALHSMEGASYVEWEGRRWYPLEDLEPERVEEGESLLFVYELPEWGFWARLRSRLSRTVTALEELHRWCYACPVPIFIDGQALEMAYNEVPLICGFLPANSNEPGLELGGAFERDRSHRKSIFCPWASSRPGRTACAVRVDHRRKVKEENICLDWIRSGVVVKREATEVGDRSVLSRVVLSTDGLRFDLTGFEFEETPASRRRRIRGVYHLNQALLSLRGDLDRDSRWQRFLNKHHSDRSFAQWNEARLIQAVSNLLETVKGQ